MDFVGYHLIFQVHTHIITDKGTDLNKRAGKGILLIYYIYLYISQRDISSKIPLYKRCGDKSALGVYSGYVEQACGPSVIL